MIIVPEPSPETTYARLARLKIDAMGFSLAFIFPPFCVAQEPTDEQFESSWRTWLRIGKKFHQCFYKGTCGKLPPLKEILDDFESNGSKWEISDADDKLV